MKTRQRFLSLVLGIVMLCSLVSMASAADDNNLNPYGAYDDTVVVTIGKPAVSSLGFLDPNDTQENNSMTRLIKDRLNIEVDVLWESDEYANKLALEFAAGTLPDMFYMPESAYLLYRQMVDNGLLYDLGSIYDECAGNYLKYVNETYNNRTLDAFTEADGSMYALASGNFDYNGHPQLWLRKDWLDALNLDIPTSLEELENVLIAFRDNYNSVGLLLNATDPLAGWNYMYNANAVAEYYGAHPNSWVYDEDGNVVYGSTQAGTKDALALLSRWYQEKLIDPEFATRDSSACNALFTSGQAGAFWGPWWSGYSYGELVNVEGAEVAIVNCPLNAEGKYNVIGAPSSANILCVRADYEHPEVAYKILNLEFEAYRGIDKEGYAAIEPDVSNGCNWEAMMPTYGMNLEKATALQSAADAANEEVENGGIKDESIYTAYEVSVAKSAGAFARGEAKTETDWINYYCRYVASNRFDNLNVTYPAFSNTTESMSDLWPSLSSLEQTTFLQIITGEALVDSFDSFVTQWYAQGGQIVTDEINSLVK